MTGLFKKAGLGVALAATALTVSAPADAQRYRGGYRHGGGDVATGAVIGGLLGLGVGAAIASSGRDRYYDRGYYDRGYYDAPRVVYRERYYGPPVVYRHRYYAPRGGYRGYDRGYYNRGYYGY